MQLLYTVLPHAHKTSAALNHFFLTFPFFYLPVNLYLSLRFTLHFGKWNQGRSTVKSDAVFFITACFGHALLHHAAFYWILLSPLDCIILNGRIPAIYQSKDL